MKSLAHLFNGKRVLRQFFESHPAFYDLLTFRFHQVFQDLCQLAAENSSQKLVNFLNRHIDKPVISNYRSQLHIYPACRVLSLISFKIFISSNNLPPRLLAVCIKNSRLNFVECHLDVLGIPDYFILPTLRLLIEW